MTVAPSRKAWALTLAATTRLQRGGAAGEFPHGNHGALDGVL
jgi:hypothetical protein